MGRHQSHRLNRIADYLTATPLRPEAIDEAFATFRNDGSLPQPKKATKPQLTRAQMTWRNGRIRRLVLEEGVAVAVVARRFDLSAARVRAIAAL